MNECQMEGAQDFVNERVCEAQAEMLSDVISVIQDAIAECVEDGRTSEVEKLQEVEDRLRARYEL